MSRCLGDYIARGNKRRTQTCVNEAKVGLIKSLLPLLVRAVLRPSERESPPRVIGFRYSVSNGLTCSHSMTDNLGELT